MPGSTCCMYLCNNNNVKAKISGEYLKFFSFPTDPELGKIWDKYVRAGIKKDRRVCQVHFKEDDYDDLVKSKLLGTRPRVLKKGVIPSVSVFEDPSKNDEPSGDSRRSRRKRQAKSYDDGDDDEDDDDVKNDVSYNENDDDDDDYDSNPKPVPRKSSLKSPAKRSRKDSASESPAVKKHDLEKEVNQLKQRLSSAEAEKTVLKKCNQTLEEDLRKVNSNFVNRAKESFKDVLSENQIDVILRNSEMIEWTCEELYKAFALRCSGVDAYKFLSNSCNYPLPDVATLENWASDWELRGGILYDVIGIMSIIGERLNFNKRLCVLCIDQMDVSPVYQFDESEDEVIRPFYNMQTIMARGLYDNWQQPVYLDFDTDITKSILDQLTTCVENADFKVVGYVLGNDEFGQKIRRELDVSVDRPWVGNRSSNEPIFVFVNAPILLASLRDSFVETGFELADCTVVCEKLEESINGSPNSKLKREHLSDDEKCRQNFQLAVQLFSRSTASELQLKDVELSNFISLVSDWFDIMNSSVKNDLDPSKSAYGVHFSQQDRRLEEMKKVMTEMRCCGDEKVQDFQEAICICISSLQRLLLYLHNKYSIGHVITRRLNQECMSDLFLQMRQKSQSVITQADEGPTSLEKEETPPPLNALRRLRKIIISKTNSNKAYFLTALALETAQIKVTTAYEETKTLEAFNNMDEKDGVNYIATTMAESLAEKHSYMLVHVKVPKEEGVTDSNGEKVERKVPSVRWLDQVSKMEEAFNKYHFNGFKVYKNVAQKTRESMVKKIRKSTIPKPVMEEFCRLRIALRCKILS